MPPGMQNVDTMDYGSTDDWDLAPVLYDQYIPSTIYPGVLTTQPNEIPIVPGPEADRFPSSSHLSHPPGAHFATGCYDADLYITPNLA